MLYVRAHTSIPVPRPWFTFTWRGIPRIVMDRVPGTTLEAIWYKLEPDEKDRYVQELSAYMRELRSLATPFGSKICSVTGGSFMDHRIQQFRPTGPFADEDAFNLATLQYVPSPHPSREDLGHHIQHSIVLTHNDFALRNVMVRNGRVTALIDWEGAGWLPAHWEVIKTYDSNVEGEHVAGAFRPYISRILPAFPVELQADETYVAPPRVIRRLS